MKKDSKSINVYWAPHSVPSDDGPIQNWNMMYEDLENVFQYWNKFDIKDGKEDSFIKCPAFQNLSKNLYAFNFPIDSSYTYKAHSNNENEIQIIPTTKNYVSLFAPRDQTMSYGPSVEFSLRLHMFAEEPLEVMITGPYLESVEYTKYGFLTSGQFDIGQWFRTLNAEIQLKGNEGEIHFKKGEPLFYIKFLTNKKINLKRFELTSEIDTYSRKCMGAKSIFGMRMTLPESYNIFNKSRTRDIVLKKIKENLI
jgi:hypothetical protein